MITRPDPAAAAARTVLIVGVLGLATVGSMALGLASGVQVGTYKSYLTATTALALASSATALLALIGLWALAAAAVATAWTSPPGGAGMRLACTVAALVVTWTASWLAGLPSVPLLLSHLAVLLYGLLPVALAGVALHLPPPRPAAKAIRAFMLGVAVSATVRVLVIGPFRDPRCFARCEPLAWDVDIGAPARMLVDAVAGVMTVVLGAAIALTMMARLRGVGGAARAETTPLTAALAASGLFVVVLETGRRLVPYNEPFAGVVMPAFGALALALAATGASLIQAAVRDVNRHRAMADLVAALEEVKDPHRLRTRLATVLGSPTEVRFPVDDGWLDLDGRAVPAFDASDHDVVTLTRSGQVVGALHSSGGIPADVWLGPAARLAIDIGRLNAEAAAHVRELQESRARIVAAGEATRRRIERDLHDGAQQRLIAASYELHAPEDPEVTWCLKEVLGVVRTLREVADRVYPAILLDRGLGAALATLADGAPIPVTVSTVPAERLSSGCELALYHVALDAVQRSARDVTAKREGLAIAVTRSGDVASMDVVGPPLHGEVEHLADRIGAVGGTLLVREGLIHAEVPCG